MKLGAFHFANKPFNLDDVAAIVHRAPRDFEALGHGGGSPDAFELPAGGVDLEQLERSLVSQALRRCAGNQTRAAALLRLNRDQIRCRVEKFRLSKSA